MRRDTTGTQLLLDGVPVGRIIQPAKALPQGGYGFELLLPPGVSTVAGIGAAQVIYTALVRRAVLRDVELTAPGA